MISVLHTEKELLNLPVDLGLKNENNIGYMTLDKGFRLPKQQHYCVHGDDMYDHIYLGYEHEGMLYMDGDYVLCGRKLYKFREQYRANNKGLCFKCYGIYKGVGK